RPSPGVAWTPVGCPGRSGVVALAGVEAGPVPAAFTAATVKVYAVPLARPVTWAVAPVTAAWAPGVLGLMSTVYPVMGLLPALAGAAQLRAALRMSAVAVRPVGAPGALAEEPEEPVLLAVPL